jgi:hypothetical protein
MEHHLQVCIDKFGGEAMIDKKLVYGLLLTIAGAILLVYGLMGMYVQFRVLF